MKNKSVPFAPSRLIAEALGAGITAAALTPYATWRELLMSKETLAESFEDGSGSIGTYELLCVQELEDCGEATLEIRVLASDGHHQLTAYFYAKPRGAEGVS